MFVLVLTGCGNLNKLMGKQNVKSGDTLAKLEKNAEAKVSLGVYKYAKVLWEYKLWIGVPVLLCIVGIWKGASIAGWIQNMIAPQPGGQSAIDSRTTVRATISPIPNSSFLSTMTSSPNPS
jgi:hypothetical protein